MTTVVLTGFMGTGKTTVGRILADRFGLELVDIDAEIERRADRTISELFAAEGEESFRCLEGEVLKDALSMPGVIIATGGGALLYPRNRALLNNTHRVICLTCRLDEIERRIGQGGERPLLIGRSFEEVATLLKAREPSYAQFDQIDTSGIDAESVADHIERKLELGTTTLRFASRRVSSVLFGRGIADRLGTVLREYELAQPFLAITDERVLEAIGRDHLLATLGSRTSLTVLPAGEEHKTLETVQRIYRDCHRQSLDRSSTMIGIGGGVIGDIAGYAAATYMRGIRLVLVPTTLLAQVDAAIGGKVAADFAGIKNLIGTFYPARIVVIDPDLLATLSDALLADGLAEIIKIAAMRSEVLLEAVETLHGPRDVLTNISIVRRAVELKVQVVEEDPYDQGERRVLNFGHTVGHAIEAASGYQLSHGKAIAIGMIAESWLAERLGIAEKGFRDRLEVVLQRLGLPIHESTIDAAAAVVAMSGDKKRVGGEFVFALAAGAGRSEIVSVSPEDARAAVEFAVEGEA